ncbi:hypothetical protein INT45_010508 [Circinella minor]|uniref:Uncharacterized protein n=1 Tax=Circinella minor TaxID=1195481 RepID=A0A8H7S1S1_9FUNG|nr:hypothetical protein INT45_010508 [Circinella minor]
MNEQVDPQTILTRYGELRSKAGNLSYDEQLEFVRAADWCVKVAVQSFQQLQPPAVVTGIEAQTEGNVLNNEEEDINNPEEDRNQALADKLVEQPKENLENPKWDIMDRCGFPIEKVERMFGSTVVKLFTHSKAHNAWTHFVYEKRKEFAAKYDVYNPVVSKSQQNDKEKTAWVNKEVARAYNAVKADKNEFKALEDRTKSYNKANGMSGNVNDMTEKQKKMMAEDTIQILRKNVQRVKELTGLESLVIFGAPQYRSSWKLRRIGTDIGVQFLDEMNAKSNSDSNFYALQERFDHFCKPPAFGTSGLSNKRTRMYNYPKARPNKS